MMLSGHVLGCCGAVLVAIWLMCVCFECTHSLLTFLLLIVTLTQRLLFFFCFFLFLLSFLMWFIRANSCSCSHSLFSPYARSLSSPFASVLALPLCSRPSSLFSASLSFSLWLFVLGLALCLALTLCCCYCLPLVTLCSIPPLLCSCNYSCSQPSSLWCSRPHSLSRLCSSLFLALTLCSHFHSRSSPCSLLLLALSHYSLFSPLLSVLAYNYPFSQPSSS